MKKPICSKCKKQMKKIGITSLFGMKTGTVYGHLKCKTMITVCLPGRRKFFTGAMVG